MIMFSLNVAWLATKGFTAGAGGEKKHSLYQLVFEAYKIIIIILMLFPVLDALWLIAYHTAICSFGSLCSGQLQFGSGLIIIRFIGIMYDCAWVFLDQLHLFEDLYCILFPSQLVLWVMILWPKKVKLKAKLKPKLKPKN